MFARFHECGELFELRTADGRLHVRNLEVESEMAVDELVIVAMGQEAESARETLATGVVLSGRAGAIAAPVTEGFHQPFQLYVVGVDGAPSPW